ncbi:alcohol dehydrogenase [Hyaloscypha sp. PMI_1271]|nr:alcohol dehydrogenase [Hyaloscypha sp. PMI_1271]
MLVPFMKAARFHPATKEVKVEQVPVPDNLPNEVLVKIGSASLCHSEIMMMDGEFPCSSEPVTLGHEGVGTVIKAGTDVKGFKAGDRIGFLPTKDCCFECEGCQVHNVSCVTGNAKLHGFFTDGFFAEYAAIDYRNCILLPESMDLKTSSPIFCAGVTAFNGVSSCECKPGDWIAIVGCGGLGQLGIQYAKALGLNVIGIDINDGILDIAKELGADVTFNSLTQKHYVDELKLLTRGGCHAAVVFSAAGAAYAGVPPILRVNGLMMIIGLPSKPIQVSTHALMLGQYRIKAETTGPPFKLPKAIAFTAKHNIQTRVEFYKIEDINTMIENMRQGKVTKRMAVVFD